MSGSDFWASWAPAGSAALAAGRELMALNGQHPSPFHELLAKERLRREVKRRLDAEELELEAGKPLRSWAGDEFLGLELPPVRPVIDRLAAEGDNVLLTAQYKTGKSTLTLNVARALVHGTPCLGRLEVPRPRRTFVLNMEMAANRYQHWLRELRLEPGAQRLLRLVNRRGEPLRLSSSAVRRRLVEELRRHETEVWLLDCFRPVAAACGLSENSNDDAGLLLSWLDEIKAEAEVATLLLVHHTGRAAMEEGAERARGATVLDDWPDVRVILTKDQHERRFLRTNGRMDEDLPESRLEFDPTTRLLTIAGEGESRAQAREDELMAVAVEAAEGEPGLSTRKLRDAMGELGVTSTTEQATGIRAAVFRGRVHAHAGARNARHHYAGHCSGECPGATVTNRDQSVTK